MADEEEQTDAVSSSVPEGPTDIPVSTPATPDPPATPANKLHEWTAAALLMMLLVGILYTFVTFIRGSGL